MIFKEILIAGLGNPGPHYAQTRHNAGALFIQTLCAQHNAFFKTQTSFNAQITSIILSPSKETLKVHCLLSLDFMNHSGRAIQAFMHYYRLRASQLLVVHDECDLAAGTFRFKQNGGHAGHNGLRDIIEQLQSSEFNRLRLGIGRNISPMTLSDYVLSSPPLIEATHLKSAIQEALIALPDWLNNKVKS